MSRYRDPQLQVTENVCYLGNLGPNIYQCFNFKIYVVLANGYGGTWANKNTECLLKNVISL